MTQAVANDMDEVALYWNNDTAKMPNSFGWVNMVNNIESELPNIWACLNKSRTYIYENWLDIEQNNMLQAEVAEYIERVKEFISHVRNFENEFCKHAESAFSMFHDVWIARKYFVLTLELEKCYKTLIIQLEAYKMKRPSTARPFRGMATEFRDFFVGVTDTELENLVLYNKPFEKRRLWKGERVEATIFARSFGISAKLMNRCFVINGKNGFHRDLNLSGDKPSYLFSNYGIYAHIEKFKHCTA